MNIECVCCGKEMPNIMERKGVQPVGGLEFHTAGHYGSTFFDPMDGTLLIVGICDECLLANSARLIKYNGSSYRKGVTK